MTSDCGLICFPTGVSHSGSIGSHLPCTTWPRVRATWKMQTRKAGQCRGESYMAGLGFVSLFLCARLLTCLVWGREGYHLGIHDFLLKRTDMGRV